MVSHKNYIGTIDIETSDGLKGSKFAIGSFYMSKKDVNEYCREIETKKNRITLTTNEDNFISITDTNKNRFFKRIYEEIKDKRIIIFIHNLDFDIRFILEYFIDVLKIHPTIIQSSSKILQIIIPEHNITIRDSLQFLLCSQEKAEMTFLGKQIKKKVDFDELLKLLESPFENIRNEAKKILKERVETDTKGLLETIVTFRNLFYASYSISLFNYVTLPAFSMALFREYLKREFNTSLVKLNPYFKYSIKEGYFWKDNNSKFWYNWIRKSYFGGINEIYDMNYLKNVYYYDENSLYPSVCIEYKFPNPTTSREKISSLNEPITLREIEECNEREELYIIEATVKENCHYPILPIRDKEERIKFVNGIKKGVWCSPQFNFFLEQEGNEIIEIHKLRYYKESQYYLRPYMYDSYQKRLESKKENNEAVSSIEKIKMNALTGKFAQRYEKLQWVMPDKEQLQDTIDGLDNEEIDLIYFNEDYSLIKQNLKTFKDFMLVEWTSFITSYSQVEMRKTHYLCKKENIEVFYSDTDCIFVNKPLETNKAFVNKIGKGILQLKNEIVSEIERKLKCNLTFDEQKELYFIEKTKEYIEIPKFDEVKFYQPKVYATKREGKVSIKAKGISTFMMYSTLNIPLNKNKESEDLFHEQIKEFSDVENLLIGGVKIDRFLKYRSALRRKQTLVTHEVIQKSMKKIYDKRRILPDLKTIPFDSSDIEKSLKMCESQNLNTLIENVNMSYVSLMENTTKGK